MATATWAAAAFQLLGLWLCGFLGFQVITFFFLVFAFTDY